MHLSKAPGVRRWGILGLSQDLLPDICKGRVLALVPELQKHGLQQRGGGRVDQQPPVLAPEIELVGVRRGRNPFPGRPCWRPDGRRTSPPHIFWASPPPRSPRRWGRSPSSTQSGGGCGPCGGARRRCIRAPSAGRRWGCGPPGSISPLPRTPPGSTWTGHGSTPASTGPGGSSISAPVPGGG